MEALYPNPLLWGCPGSLGGTQVFSQGQEGGAVLAQLSGSWLRHWLGWAAPFSARDAELRAAACPPSWGQGMGSGTGWACMWQWLLSWHRERAETHLSANPRAIHTPADSSGHFTCLVLLVLGRWWWEGNAVVGLGFIQWTCRDRFGFWRLCNKIAGLCNKICSYTPVDLGDVLKFSFAVWKWGLFNSSYWKKASVGIGGSG